jgi:hypothetical protein
MKRFIFSLSLVLLLTSVVPAAFLITYIPTELFS